MLILLRHGQTAANAQARLQGHIDLPLDEVGVEQARKCGEYLRATFGDLTVISSPLMRAQQTAGTSSVEMHGLRGEKAVRLRESVCGERRKKSKNA